VGVIIGVGVIVGAGVIVGIDGVGVGTGVSVDVIGAGVIGAGVIGVESNIGLAIIEQLAKKTNTTRKTIIFFILSSLFL
jgi:hypothetical protein